MGPRQSATATYNLSHTIVLTRRCGYRCGYCDFPVLPSEPLPSRKALAKSLRIAAAAGVVQVQITAGEGIANDTETIGVIRYYGLNDYTHYLKTIFKQAVTPNGRRGLLPVPQLGNLSLSQMHKIKRYIPCVKILLESADPNLQMKVAHARSSCKAPEKRLEAILNAGQAGIPTTSGILVGIGDSRPSRDKALRLILEAHRRFGHIQNIVIARFQPKPCTEMADWDPAPVAEVLRSVAVARKLFGPDFPITVSVLEEPELLNDCLEAGVNDFGDVELSGDESADADTLHRLQLTRSYCEGRGVELRERLPVFPSHQSEKWLSPELLDIIEACRIEELIA